MSVTLSYRELWMVTLSAVRYAMGRSSYIVGDTCDFVRRNLQDLSPAHREQLRREITDAQGLRQLGMQMDHDEWTRLAIDLGQANQ